ncbi:hypothetical protein [Nitrosococcus wardiae]|uniref:Uncharacterized protein n=1 Tax=Nitrosococcus wardiae TaxID=1814290 RepID=A0A4P7C4T9_9GAMM|nr:hypothetical protein [Nitrosococcus wardiae]QBQ55822.1 hypothetical protein E3U44_15855 [Nitrosococcus wardiae]
MTRNRLKSDQGELWLRVPVWKKALDLLLNCGPKSRESHLCPTHRRIKARNVRNFTRRLQIRWRDYCANKISFAEFDASVQGWINHVRTPIPGDYGGISWSGPLSARSSSLTLICNGSFTPSPLAGEGGDGGN